MKPAAQSIVAIQVKKLRFIISVPISLIPTTGWEREERLGILNAEGFDSSSLDSVRGSL